MTTGQRIKAARKKTGITQAELARRLNVPYQSVSQWERGTRNPKFETLFNIADALNVGIDELYDFSIEAEQERTLLKINNIKEQLKAATDQERQELEDSLWILEESYEDITLASALKAMADANCERIKRPRERLNKAFDSLNESGQQKAIERVEELTEIPRYQAAQPAPTYSPIIDVPETEKATEGGSEPKKDNGTKGPVATCGDDSPN